MWGGKYAERLNLLYMQGIKHINLVNYRPRLLLNKMQGKLSKTTQRLRIFDMKLCM